MGVFGDTLRQARAYKGVTIKEAEQATRINRHHLAALEDENFSALPPLIYQRGIVRNYAAYLDLDSGKLLTMFEEAHGIDSRSEVVPAVKPLDMPSHFAPNFAIIAFMVVMSAIVFAWAYSAYFAPEEPSPTAAALIPTVTPLPVESVALATVTPVPATTVAPQKAGATTASAAATVTPSAVPPTATASAPTATATAPTAEEPIPTDPPVEAAAAVDEEPAVDEPAPTPIPSDVLVLSFAAGESPVNLTVTADGVLLFQGYLGPGESTGQLSGQSYYVVTDSIENTWITNISAGGNAFVMPGAGPGEFGLP